MAYGEPKWPNVWLSGLKWPKVISKVPKWPRVSVCNLEGAYVCLKSVQVNLSDLEKCLSDIGWSIMCLSDLKSVPEYA